MNGRKLTATDALGYQASWTYASYGRLTTMTGYDGSLTTYTYDHLSELRTASQPGKGQAVTYTYNGAGQVASITDYTNGSSGDPSLNKQADDVHLRPGRQPPEREDPPGRHGVR